MAEFTRGLAALQRKIEKAKAAYGAELHRAVGAAARVLQKFMKLQVSGRVTTPTSIKVVTGTLRRSITARPVGQAIWRVGPNVPYARIHDEGGTIPARAATSSTGKHFTMPAIIIPARPYRVPALMRAKPEMIAIVRRTISTPLQISVER